MTCDACLLALGSANDRDRTLMVASLSGSITHQVASHGVYAVFLLMALDAVFPAGSELVMVFAGAIAAGVGGASVHLLGLATRSGVGSYLLLSSAGTLGYLAGACLGWLIGVHGGRRFLERHGGWLHLPPPRVRLAERWFRRWGWASVALGRLVPLVRSFISIPAGVFEVSFAPYVLLTLVGSAVWCFVLAAVGWALGASYVGFDGAFTYAEYAVVGARRPRGRRAAARASALRRAADRVGTARGDGPGFRRRMVRDLRMAVDRRDEHLWAARPSESRQGEPGEGQRQPRRPRAFRAHPRRLPWLEDKPTVIVVAAAGTTVATVFALASAAGWTRVVRLTGERHAWLWLLVCFAGEVVAYAGYMLTVRDMARVDDCSEMSLSVSAKTVVAGFGVFAATRSSGGFAVDNWAFRQAGASESRGGSSGGRARPARVRRAFDRRPRCIGGALLPAGRAGGGFDHVASLLILPFLALGVFLTSPKRARRLSDPAAASCAAGSRASSPAP